LYSNKGEKVLLITPRTGRPIGFIAAEFNKALKPTTIGRQSKKLAKR